MYRFRGGDKIVWDKDNNKILARFKNGFFQTDDKRVAGILTEKGFIEIEGGDDMALTELSRKQAVELKKEEYLANAKAEETVNDTDVAPKKSKKKVE